MLGVEQRGAVDLDRRRAEPDHHRHAARAGQHGDMARRAAGGQRDAAAEAPVGLEEAGRRDVVAEQDGARRARFVAAIGQRRAAPGADVLEIGGARPEIVVVGNLVADDLGIDGVDPGIVGRGAFGDRREGRLGQRLVVQHRKLELEDRGALLGSRRHQRADARRGVSDRCPQRFGSRLWGSPRAR